MGSSSLRSIIIELILDVLFTQVGRKKYRFLSSELGHNIDKSNNLSYDIAIFEKTVLTAEMIDVHHVKIAPKIVIEIDVRIDLENTSDLEYIDAKTQKVLDAGTEKLIWIFTKTQKIIIAEPDKNWEIVFWNKSIQLIDNQFINIHDLLKEEGILLK
ncbi:MAG: Uma2 family endonuclease [Saprospiraceae bacterium]|nr:Uma2 family endonuclease [Saprospiraceae bacterium]